MRNAVLNTCFSVFLIQLCFVSLAESLNCYQCSSETEYTCGEFFSAGSADVRLTECPMSNAKYCVKTTGIFSGNLGAKRFCSERYLDNYCTYVQRPGDQREYRSCVYTCTGDGCNGSAGLNAEKLIQISALFVPLVAIVTYRRF